MPKPRAQPPRMRSVKKMDACYNIFEVMILSSKVEQILKDVRMLSPAELKELVNKITNDRDLVGWLKLAEQPFSDWDNPEDEVYDQL